MNIELKVAQLLASRICHDLAGGISAVGTGVELLTDDSGALDDGALKLIADSAQQSSRRLQFLRTAFGQGGGQGGEDGVQTIAIADLRALTHGFLDGSRVSLVWDDDDVERFDLGAGKLLLNLCLIGVDALPRGGVLSVGIGQVEGRMGFAVAAQGDGARLSNEFQRAMHVDADTELLTARTVNGHFTVVLAAKLAAELEIQVEDGGEVRFAVLMTP
jgi:histidine phosphotransferase ChpT